MHDCNKFEIISVRKDWVMKWTMLGSWLAEQWKFNFSGIDWNNARKIEKRIWLIAIKIPQSYLG